MKKYRLKYIEASDYKEVLEKFIEIVDDEEKLFIADNEEQAVNELAFYNFVDVVKIAKDIANNINDMGRFFAYYVVESDASEPSSDVFDEDLPF